ncbi:MAG TPA: hypothetical protein VNJ02_04130 [Vicinamibacterales bacterium]|nr:hypothetical protein [Vicinamibacterales bacterium]
MIPDLRRAFNAAWSDAQYATFLTTLHSRIGAKVEFPVSETPCFFPQAVIDDLAAAGADLIRQSMAGEAARAGAAVVPEQFRSGQAGAVPTFLQVDFGLARSADGGLEPKLVELQAFPSLYAFQTALADAYQSAFVLPASLNRYLSGLTEDSYRTLLRDAITGGHDPKETVLMEIEPDRQKTRPDFLLTEQIWGVGAVDTTAVIKEGRQLFYRRDGRKTLIRRIYNRVIPDELVRKNITLPFDYRDDLDVEWTGHPEWYFRISKFSIPFLKHPSVPRTWFLNEVNGLPEARERLLLKPLFSFAGGGIVFAPTDAQLAAVPADQRDQYILQERIDFAPVIDTPYGPTQAEIRMMYVWTDQLRAVLPLVRMGRGMMMGVDHNKGLRWVGASAGLVA